MERDYEDTRGNVYAIWFQYEDNHVAVQTVRRGRTLKVPELVLSDDRMTNEEIGMVVRRSFTHTHLRDGMDT